MAWRPIHPNHAIERTRIVVYFKDRLPEKTISKVAEDFDGKRAAYGMSPRVRVQGQTITMGSDNRVQPLSTPPMLGWMFAREPAPQTIAEAIVLDPESILYETIDYVRWSGFWDRAASILLPMLDGLTSVVDIRAFGLEYFDRFLFDGLPTDASPGDIINAQLTAVLPPSARTGEQMWHLNRGWFDVVGGVRVLINQNIDSSNGNIANRGATPQPSPHFT